MVRETTCSRLYQAPILRSRYCPSTALHAELAKDVVDVRLDGAHGDDQLVRDLGVVEQRHDGVGHLANIAEAAGGDCVSVAGEAA